ncbi:hypothetical protein FTV88_2212 [Heliorestis convoluta]|uniref:Site-specific DNA-methyltransferase n=1 Tax=Heliorestis convoluta TaxID=356322 RepID=A0A5Q2N7S0_9FIRM|nr:hypothetical protein FTV88_2212 [Heliorestis convoluta]
MTKNSNSNLQLDTIHNIDIHDGLRLLPDNSIDLIIADPPYGIRHCKSPLTWLRHDLLLPYVTDFY